MSHLVEDCLRIIFTKLQYDSNSLYSCILVNSLWCMIGVQILWKNPYETLNNRNQYNKFFNTIIYLLPASSKKLLNENNVVTLSIPFSTNKPLFNYISFSSKISSELIYNMGLALINEVLNSYEYQEKYKILEQEIYKLLISNCKNITDFNWFTTLPLYQYPGASTFFSQLRTLDIECNQSLDSEKLLGMAQICQNIEILKIWYYGRDIPRLIEFIDNQKNLQSLHLYGEENLIFTKFFPSLINLEYLKLYYCYHSKEYKQKLQKYLSIASFPRLQYLKVHFLPYHDVCKLIENSHENIKEISTWSHFKEKDDSTKLFRVIAKNCPKIESLEADIQLRNLLSGLKEIFLNCNKLRKLFLSNNENGDVHDDEIICDEVLNVLSNYSSKTFEEFSFNSNWYFSVNGLQNFFESWRGRKPIKFVTHFDKCRQFTEEHIKIVKKYYDEGVIDKETKYLFGVK
ncbi:hypothetical protein RhiirA5_500029 [Rhizophagus irregularis]|uniref:F-box domain-containing protein n=1 Tax=Rhizophagus irregularis TaxID=588596 RepID=A0A2N0PNG6_9GLOM|nr:hypothetical protein RhiirA5_500029 [Rhizophagus irregularis]